MKTGIIIALVSLSAAVSGRAEVVLLKNGDRLSGDWIRIISEKVVFKSDVVGEVSIPVAKLEKFSPAGPAVVLLRGGQTFSGEISLGKGGEWEVQGEQEKKTFASTSVLAIYPEKVYQPGSSASSKQPWRNWRGRGNFGYSLLRGDRRAGTLTLGLDAMRRQPDLPDLSERSRTHFSAQMLLASTREPSGIGTSANSLTSSLRQDFLFTPHNFVFTLGQLEHIEAQSLNLRQTYGVGLGRDVLRNPQVTLSLLDGVTLVKERFQTSERRKDSEGLFGEKLTVMLSDRVGINHGLNLYPSLSNAGAYRADGTFVLSTRISSRLSLTTGLTDRYISRPLPGRQRNEVLLTTGLGVNFGR